MKQQAYTPFAAVAILASACAFAALPEASNVGFNQDADTRVATITYTLSAAPAIVTLDIQTNGANGAWVSIGGKNINRFTADSDVFRKVTTAGAHTIKWRPDKSWPGNVIAAGGARAVVTAWAVNNPPDYMVVDITEKAQPNTERYYPSAEFIPGGLVSNVLYYGSSIVMRKVDAKDITWTMGSFGEYGRTASNEASHMVTLTNDYWMGVFPVTQGQWAQVMGNWPAKFTNVECREYRPVEYVSYNEIRTSSSSDNAYRANNDFPNPPHGSSFLGILRTRTGLDFDLPGEAQWEYACRAGNYEDRWGDGSVYDYTGSYQSAMTNNIPGVVSYNGGRIFTGVTKDDKGNDVYNFADPPFTCTTEHGTPFCGSSKPNSWGIYEMHGGVYELCLDWYADSIDLDYRVNVDPANPANLLSSPGVAGTAKVKRGGSYQHAAHQARAAHRNKESSKTRWEANGFRIMCPIAQ